MSSLFNYNKNKQQTTDIYEKNIEDLNYEEDYLKDFNDENLDMFEEDFEQSTNNSNNDLLKEFNNKVSYTKNGYKIYDKQEVNNLIRRYRENKDEFALIQLYEMNKALFKNNSNKFWYLQGITYESEMNLAFWQAIKTYDIDNPYNAHFNTYFRTCVNNRLKVAINQEKAVKRKSNYDGLSFDDNYSDGTEKDTKLGDIIQDSKAQEEFETIEKQEIIKNALALLTEEEKDIVLRLMDGQTYKKIANARGLTSPTIFSKFTKIKSNKKFINIIKELVDVNKTTFVILDGTNLACRALYASPNGDLITTTGIKTGYIYRFLKMFMKIVEETNPTHIVVCWDVDRNTWRKQLYEEYKANRGDVPHKEKIAFKPIKDILESIGVLNVEFDGYEGDDLCGTFVNKSLANKTYVVSGDRDTFQLVTPTVDVLYIGNKERVIVDEEYIKENYEITPDKFVFLKTLMGDTSDNIPGINGVALKGAIKLVNKFDSLDTLTKNFNHKEYGLSVKQQDAIKEWKSRAKTFQKLVTIKQNVPIEYDMEDCINKIDWNNAIELFKKFEFNSLIDKINELPRGVVK